MDAVRDMGIIVKKTAELTKDNDALAVLSWLFSVIPLRIIHLWRVPLWCHWRDSAISVGVSGPGAVKHALESVRGQSFDVVAETIKRTASKLLV